jgi:hypothetical protein
MRQCWPQPVLTMHSTKEVVPLHIGRFRCLIGLQGGRIDHYTPDRTVVEWLDTLVRLETYRPDHY